MKYNFSDIRYLIISALTLPFTSGGGRHAFSFARFLVRQSKEVTILSLNPGGDMTKSEIIQGVRIVRKPVFQKNLILRIISYLLMIPAAIRLAINADVIFIYGRYFVLHRFIIIMGKILGKCIVFRSTMLGEDDFDSLLSGGSVSAWIKRKIYSLVSVYFSITPEFSERYRKFYPSKRIFENPQGVDTERFFPVLPDVKTKLRKRMEIPDGLTVLLSVGTPVYRKGYMELFTILSGLTVPFLYVIAGETDVTMSPHLAKKPGEIRDTIANGEKLLGSRVRFTGMVDNLNEWMNIADIFILNSEQEGLPNSLLECLASGTMILMRNIGGLEGYILKDGENAFLYRDGEGFEKTINKLMKDPGSVTDPGNDFARKVRERISMDIVYRDLKKSISEGSGKK